MCQSDSKQTRFARISFFRHLRGDVRCCTKWRPIPVTAAPIPRVCVLCAGGGVTDFWDTAGQERFSSMHPSYYYRAHACVLVFDVTRKATYKNLSEWYGELRQYCEGIPCLLVANKIDVDYNVRRVGGCNNKAVIFLLLRRGCHIAGLGNPRFTWDDVCRPLFSTRAEVEQVCRNEAFVDQ